MKINEVEALVGITRKNIRFYEAEGLLSPRRNSQNGYRDYGETEVEVLRRIKLLRKLGLPLEEIRQMQHGAYTVGDGMRRHLVSLERERQNLEAAIRFCGTLTDRRERLEELDAQSLLDRMAQMEQEGTTFMNKQKQDTRRRRFVAPIVVAIVMSVLMAGLIWLFLWAFEVDPAGAPPLPVLALFVAIPAAVVVGVSSPWSSGSGRLSGERKTMRGTTERRDCRQAAVSAAGTAVWLLAAAAVLLWVRQAFFPSGAASVLLAVLAAVQAAGLIPLGLALRDRLKEIKGGELYEARQY